MGRFGAFPYNYLGLLLLLLQDSSFSRSAISTGSILLCKRGPPAPVAERLHFGRAWREWSPTLKFTDEHCAVGCFFLGSEVIFCVRYVTVQLEIPDKTIIHIPHSQRNSLSESDRILLSLS